MQLYNTMTRRKETLLPVVPNQIGMYGCGPTVYDYFHIGNARMFVVFDTMRRFLEHRGYHVTFVQNFTDIDDKMIRRANEEGTTVAAVADRFIAAYFEDAKALGIRPADVHPKATEHIPEIISLIERLIQNGFAYNSSGDVYFDTQAYGARYGKLSGQDLSALESGARVDVAEIKQNPMDFALWKGQKPGEPAWDSPWGKGRPGWHIECSAMSMKYLGDTFDIHCGGQDLVFPHHENELAQSEGATGKPLANYWVHNGFLNIENEKMSKSLGNFFTTRDILKHYDAQTVRFFLLSAHYRSPLNFSPQQMEQAKTSLARLHTARANWAFLQKTAVDRQPNDAEQQLMTLVATCAQQFDDTMDDDLNTADALGVMFTLVKEGNIALQEGATRIVLEQIITCFDEMADVLGLAPVKEEGVDADAEALVDARAEARKAKNWAESDRLRKALSDMGYQVEDTPQGQKLRKG